ncbi:glutamate N-acetyltransferase Ecym_3421 [Eremothecium cymbalariae DBVPG|uniref:Arginine biosynthesis bifunctional protein ArgJ, mitochondrial n=1 Tax=Eremothecium cymbalariae (strain CBS 270.75 / DBVPG 7215 / KCTC 17166 / NRRL Y-17582) TaxID=931890 RepID=G8JRY8_ERECY|nr:Hypothetical protein Ecym_3421 [Eremothecium cymbalariae DBVPG\
MKASLQICKRAMNTVDKYSLYVPKSGVFPKCLKVASIASGIKKNGNLDLGIILNTHESLNGASLAGVFTTNKFQAAPVVVSKNVLEQQQGHNINAIVINSGCANAVTGEVGMHDARDMVQSVNSHIGRANSTLVMSTGVIGQLLPMEKVKNGIDKMFLRKGSTFGEDYSSWLNLAKSITTTDTFPKIISSRFTLPNGVQYTLTGIAKGAGMISPNMATLLGVICTDLPISPSALQSMLLHATSRSFNCISVDGDMSTNDTLYMMANGAIETDIITESSPYFNSVQEKVVDFSQKLAQLIVRDGEGATKLVTVNVRNSLNFEDAKVVAESISNSMLVKTALYGEDVNWGRILCAIGYAKLGDVRSLDVTKLKVSFVATDNSEPNELVLIENGVPQVNINESRASEILALPDIKIVVDLGTGKEECNFWTCDLSHEYVTINGDYRS